MKQLSILLVFLALPFLLLGDDIFTTDYRLFHVERSKNKNIVCYDANVINKRLDESNPINVYWINREERMGEKNGLNAIQRRLAYGYKILSKSENSASIALNACPDRKMVIEEIQGKYQCTIVINNKKSILQKIYVKTKTPNSIKVEYVELTGSAIDSGELITEKIYN